MFQTALVTGGNKGIGFAICRGLAKAHPGMKVLLGSRDPMRGKQAEELLHKEGLKNGFSTNPVCIGLFVIFSSHFPKAGSIDSPVHRNRPT